MRSIAILALGALLGIAVMLAVPHGAPQLVFADPPSGNGDVNGSGKIDVADAIYLLSYLFAQGPAPEAIESAPCDSCCPPCPPSSLPATGQTTCYDSNENAIECASAEYPGQDGFYRKGCSSAVRFVDNGDGTVTDTCTGLMWQKESTPVPSAWQNALQYCESLQLAGHGDWRLPNMRELESILDYGRYFPSLDSAFEGGFDSHWSSTTYSFGPRYAWSIAFHQGTVAIANKNVADRIVRAVRGP